MFIIIYYQLQDNAASPTTYRDSAWSGGEKSHEGGG
jgi:hypothetical protein